MQSTDEIFLKRRDEQRVLVVLFAICIVLSAGVLSFGIANGIETQWNSSIHSISVALASATLVVVFSTGLTYLHFYY